MVILFHRGGRYSSRSIFLTTGDWLVIIASQFGAVFLRLGLDSGLAYLSDYWGSLVLAILLYMVVFYAGGMYEPPTRHQQMDFDFLPLIMSFIASIIAGMLLFARPEIIWGRGIWMISSLLILAGTYGLRQFFMYLVKKGFFLKPSLVLTDSYFRAVELLDLFKQTSFVPYHLVGTIWCGRGTPPPREKGIPPVLGELADLAEMIDEYNVSTLLLAVSSIHAHEILPQLRPLRYAGVELMDYVALSEEIAQEIPLNYINDEWLMTATLNSSILQVRKLKRVMDVAASFIGLLIGLPLMALAGILIKATSPGPMLYKQTRAGLGGKPYTLYKLRTMRMDAETNGAVWAQYKDPRVTRVGYFLRKWRIDEIPQLFNIIKGEMSLVGPRPERPEFTEQLMAHIPFYSERQLVQPGLTGWAQVRYPYAASVDAASRKLQFDLYYIKNMSFLLDIAILLKTTKTIIAGLRHEDQSVIPPSDTVEAIPLFSENDASAKTGEHAEG